jgi:MutS domain V
MNTIPSDFYNSLILDLTQKLKQVNKLINVVSFSRLGVFILILLSIFLITTSLSFYAYSLLGFSVIGFALLVKYQLKLEKEKTQNDKLLEINKNELEYLTYNYSKFSNGSEFIDINHPFTSDLDVFGNGSLFQYLNRTSTLFGRNILAEIFNNLETNIDKIISRQDACKDLTGKSNWRQKFQATGSLTKIDASEIYKLKRWLNEPGNFIHNRKLIYSLWILPSLTFLSIIFWLITKINVFTEVLLTIQFIYVLFKQRQINVIHEKLSNKNKVIQSYSELLFMIEQEKFSAAELKNAQSVLVNDKNSAAKQIKRLSVILNAFDRRLNLLVSFILNTLYMADIWNVVYLEKWKETNKTQVDAWFNSIGKFDAFSSLANYAFNNPDFTFPEFNTVTKNFQATDIGHPLINPNKRICNDFILDEKNCFVILTGANMAGKSTFLRTIGLNMILGMTGAPVCAKQLSFYPMTLITSISVKDSLLDNESYFYAELKRLKLIIDELNAGKKIFILLDEILKGTNSNDKMNGSKALMKQFIQLEATGIIATHDVSLGEIENQYPKNIINHLFEVELDGERLFYDYKLRKGVCQKINATFLMKKMGIIID